MTPKRIRDYHTALAVKVTPIVRREVYLDHMTFAANGGPMFTEIFGPLPGLKEEWAEQDATPEEIDLSTFRYRAPMKGGLPIATGFIHGQDERILDEDDEYLTAIDAMGRTVRLAKLASSLPLPLDYPVKDMDDWLAYKHHYEFDDSRRADVKRAGSVGNSALLRGEGNVDWKSATAKQGSIQCEEIIESGGELPSPRAWSC